MIEELANNKDSALKVNEGIPQPPSVSPTALARLKAKKKKALKEDDYVKGILEGSRTLLSKAITMIESSLPNDHKMAQMIIEKCLPHAGKSIRIGITGVPGVGKSTFIESLGNHLTSQGHKVAVLAIDPSSQRTKGSILGDKTRMETLCNNPDAFIRPSASAGSLGGVARKTRESIVLCEASGYDIILVETVGVGQSETEVHNMVDFFLLLMLSGAGDELQGIKRGIMEMADALIVNKADGDNENRAGLAKVQYQTALHLFPPTESGWSPKVDTCSAMKMDRIANVWKIISEYKELTTENGYFNKRRQEQAIDIMFSSINDALETNFYNNSQIEEALEKAKEDILQNKVSSYIAAQRLLDSYFGNL
ncbi:MAG: methylmalonyl Co-A mutase-associated GTPase MeaB [Hyphomicrobiales bacterium]